MQKNTVRTVLAQVLVCKGCCCGNMERGKPEVPVDWLKAEWKKQGLLKRIHLTITGCLGPCDIPNVVSVVYPAGSLWLGGITTRDEYQALIDWAVRCRDGGHVQDFPRELTEHRVSPPFLSSSAGEMTAL